MFQKFSQGAFSWIPRKKEEQKKVSEKREEEEQKTKLRQEAEARSKDAAEQEKIVTVTKAEGEAEAAQMISKALEKSGKGLIEVQFDSTSSQDCTFVKKLDPIFRHPVTRFYLLRTDRNPAEI